MKALWKLKRILYGQEDAQWREAGCVVCHPVVVVAWRLDGDLKD